MPFFGALWEKTIIKKKGLYDEESRSSPML